MLKKIYLFLFIFLFLLFVISFLWISDLFLSVWEKLSHQPQWFVIFYLSLSVLLLLGLFFLIFRLFYGKAGWAAKNIKDSADDSDQTVNDETRVEQIEQKIEALQEKSVDVSVFRQELEQLQEQKSKKDIYIVLFGNISSGKTSLIQAILPDASCKVDVIGGTTREIVRYHWQSPLGEQIFLTDTPGFDEQFAKLDELSREAVYRAHLAIYLCEGDLTATQYRQIEEINTLEKPLIVALNKTDRYSSDDLQMVQQQLEHKLAQINPEITLVQIQTGGQREVIVILPDNTEQKRIQNIKPVLTPLLLKITEILQQYSLNELEAVRQSAVLKLLEQHIQQTERHHRQQQADKIIQASTQKAVLAALATVAPGSDLLIQGYLAMSMIKSLCETYEVSVKEVDIEQLLNILQNNTKNVFPLLLGIAGNGFKAFPGLGSVAGGLLHAVAYGLIFDSVGKAVKLSLETDGSLSPLLVEDIYKEKLVENVESRTMEFIKMVIKSKKDS